MGEFSIISDLLQQLLSSHNRVSLPGLGAFVVSHAPATLIKGGKGMLPPGKQISFLSTETWNDELLEQAFGKHHGLGQEEAKYRLKLFADKVGNLLKSGRRIEFPGLGTLRMTADCELRFTAEDTRQFSTDSFGLLEIEMTPLPPELLPYKTGEEKQAPPAVITEPQPKKRPCSVICWIFLILLLLAGSIYLFRHPLMQWIEEMSYTTEELAYLHRPQPSAQESLPALPTPPVVQPDTMPVIKEEIPTQPVIAQPVPEQTVKQEQTGKSKPMNRYHIIVAGFEQETEARQLAKKITDTEGYICLVIHTGGNRPYKVSILRYNSQQEADVILNGIKKTDSSDYHNAWVEKY